MDLFGPIKPDKGFCYILVITDAFSKYVVLIALRNKESQTIANVFYDKWICLFGCPDLIVTDRGTEFNNALLKELTNNLGTKYKTTTAYHPQTNGQAEIFDKIPNLGQAHYQL